MPTRFTPNRLPCVLRTTVIAKHPPPTQLQYIHFRQFSSSSSKFSSSSNNEEFYRYTTGRWLWDEETQLKNKYKRFNVPELKKLAAQSAGAKRCVSMTKVGEGAYNRIFRLEMDNGSKVIARIPYPIPGPRFKAVASEVATMEFARNILHIPVPRVLDWSGKEDNPVESEYFLMEEATGTQLGEIWHEMETNDKIKVVDEIVAVQKKLISLSFTRYGNLYFTNDSFPGCQKAEAVGDVSESVKDQVQNRFVIGPVVDLEFWSQERASMDIDCGPWQTPQEYLKAIAYREINWINHHAVPKDKQGLFTESPSQKIPSAHIELYNKFLAVADYILPTKKELIRPTLWHPDLYPFNIFVDEKSGSYKITGLIDWHDAWAGPLFLQSRPPPLIRHPGELTPKLPENFKDLDEDEKAQATTQLERSTVYRAFEDATRKINPVLDEISHIPHAQTTRGAVSCASNTWDEGLLLFRQTLIRVARHWKAIDNRIICPISFTEEEINANIEEGEGYNSLADFWDTLHDIVQRSDGWTANEHYDTAMEIFADLRTKLLAECEGQEWVEFEKRTRWAARGGKKEDSTTQV